MHVVKPNTGEDFMEKQCEGVKNQTLPGDMYALITDLLIKFNYDEGKSHDVAKYILDADVDMALVDCVPMKSFFGMCANKFEEKEDWTNEKIKIMVESGLSDSKEKITVQKGKVKSSPEYRKLLAKKVRYARRKKDCRVLEGAMEMRLSMAQSRGANYRSGMAPGTYQNQKQ